MAERAVVVVAGGGMPSTASLETLPAGAPVVAADSGVDVAIALGLRVDVVIGDLDSISPEGLGAARDGGARIVRYPEAKDATDLALALGEAAALLDTGNPADLARPDEQLVVVLGGHGGRLDHLLAGILALADPEWAAIRIRAHLGPATVHVLHGPTEREVGGAAGDLLTLIPVGGPAHGVRTRGLRYPLHDERLDPGTTRGVSNVVEREPAVVAVASGTLLAVLPGGEAEGGHL